MRSRLFNLLKRYGWVKTVLFLCPYCRDQTQMVGIARLDRQPFHRSKGACFYAYHLKCVENRGEIVASIRK